MTMRPHFDLRQIDVVFSYIPVEERQRYMVVPVASSNSQYLLRKLILKLSLRLRRDLECIVDDAEFRFVAGDSLATNTTNQNYHV